MQHAKGNLFNKRCWKNRAAACKSMKLGHFLTAHIKLTQMELEYKTLSIKILKENIGVKLFDIGLEYDFFRIINENKSNERKRQVVYHQTKNILHIKGNNKNE